VATFTTTTLPVGSDSITASYAASGNYTASTSGTVTVTVAAAGTQTVGIGFSSNTLTVKAGSVGQLTLTVSPVGGFVGTVNLACSGLPAESSCVFNPTSLTFTAANNNQAQTITMNVATSGATAALQPFAPLHNSTGSSMPMLAGAFWLPGLLAAGVGLRKKNASRTLHLLVLLVLLAGVGMMTACGGGTPTSTTTSQQNAGTPAGDYTVTVMANGTGVTPAPSKTFNLQVQ
jgi:hypothetical protein